MTPAQKTIATFDGVRATARALGIDAAIVSRWQKKGFVPAAYQARVLAAAKKAGKKLGAADLVGST